MAKTPIMANNHQMEANTTSRGKKKTESVVAIDLQCSGVTHILTDRLSDYLRCCCFSTCTHVKLSFQAQLLLHRCFVWIPSNLHPVSQAINQSCNFRNKTMLDLCDTCASNIYSVSQAINQNSDFRNKPVLDLCDTCAGGTSAAFQTGYTVGPKA